MSATEQSLSGDKFRTTEDAVREVLPRMLEDGYHSVVEIPVFEAYENEFGTVKASSHSSPTFRVSVDVQRSEDGNADIWGLWDPEGDAEYIDHSVQAEGIGHGHYDPARLSVEIEEWLNEKIEEYPNAVERYIVEDNRDM